MAAMASHGSQITAEWLDASTFGPGYGREWFVRHGRPGILDTLAAHPPAAEAGADARLVTAGRR